MSKTIWKFNLPVTDHVSILMPKGAQLLVVQVQLEQSYLWAVVDPEAQTERRHFRVFGTGHPFTLNWPIDSQYVGTFQLRGGSLVFHVFEIRA